MTPLVPPTFPREGHHTLTERFVIGSPLTVVANTAHHYMNVYRDGKLFAHWPISTGRPRDESPNGTYLTIEKANPVDMVGPGYNIEVPWSVRVTWSGDYLHDAYWSVGEQGFTNVSHGCVNMSPADAETYYKMAMPGDPVKITGSPRGGAWDNGWTMWFLSWKKWVRGSALQKAVRASPRVVSPASLSRHQPSAPETWMLVMNPASRLRRGSIRLEVGDHQHPHAAERIRRPQTRRRRPTVAMPAQVGRMFDTFGDDLAQPRLDR